MSKFEYRQSFLEKLWFIFSQRLHRRMVSRQANFYLRPLDIISHRPSLFGYHEPHIEGLIKKYSAEYGDFLLDIGSNVGLTSCLTGDGFKRIDCVEPNDLAANILETNLAINLTGKDVVVHRIGLGEKNANAVLSIPVDNFGGAYFEDGNPQFDTGRIDALPASYSRGRRNVIERMVKIRKAQNWLKGLFKDYSGNGMRRGIIKIDVEGHEENVFRAILETLPDEFAMMVVMENWFDRFPITEFSSKRHAMEWFHLRKRLRPMHSIPFKLLGLSSSYVIELVELDDETDKPHDVVCFIRPATA